MVVEIENEEKNWEDINTTKDKTDGKIIRYNDDSNEGLLSDRSDSNY